MNSTAQSSLWPPDPRRALLPQNSTSVLLVVVVVVALLVILAELQNLRQCMHGQDGTPQSCTQHRNAVRGCVKSSSAIKVRETNARSKYMLSRKVRGVAALPALATCLWGIPAQQDVRATSAVSQRGDNWRLTVQSLSTLLH